MNEREDQMFADFLREGPERGPADGPEGVFARTRSMRQRPAWTFVSRWTAAAWPEQRILAPAVLVAVLLLVLVLAAVAFVGNARQRVAPLTGPAGNGRIAWDTGQGGQVFLAAPDGTDPHPIQGAYAITRSPSFARDGSKVAFWSRENQDPGTLLNLFVADADGSHVHPVATGVDTNVFFAPEWAPDGQHIVYAAMEGGISRLYLVPTDGSAPPRAITGTDAWRDAPAWSPDGRWIAFHKLLPGPGGVSSFTVMPADGSGPERDLHRQPDPKDQGSDNGPIWAPDSSAIAYSRLGNAADPDEESWHAYLEVTTLDGTEHKLFEDPYGSISWPDWSPDGAWIVAGVGDTEPGHAILVRPDGSERRSFANGPVQGGTCGMQWAPDARSVVSPCAGFLRFSLGDLEHPQALPVPSAAVGFGWQRGPLP
jgi:Tol biopolymer transport system component